MDKKLKDGTVNNNGEDCCGYCFENVEYMIDPRVLPCSHIYCLPCLQADFLKNKILECRMCKKNHETVEVDNLEQVEKLVLSDSTEDDSPPTYCDICKTQELAISYCVDCGKKMCLKHDEYHDEYQKAFSRYKHKKVSEEEYRSAPDRYELRTCPNHEEEELKKVCKHCYKTFCYGCETDKKCSVLKEEVHELEDIEVLSQRFKDRLEKMLNSLSSKVGDVYALEKQTNIDIEIVEEKACSMTEEVDRIVDEQVSSIREKAEQLKNHIELYRQANVSKVGDFLLMLQKKKAELGSLWKSTNKSLSTKHDVEIIKSYTKMVEDMTKAVVKDLGHCQLPLGRMLVSTGEHRDLEVQLRECIPLLLDLKFKEKKVSGHCSCIYSLPDHSLLCGRESSLSILSGSTFEPLKSLNSSNVNGVAPHKQGFLALHWENGKNYIILYSPELVFLKLFGEFFRPTDKYSQMCVARDHVVAMDPDEKQLNVYSVKGEFQFTTKLSNDKRPWGVQGTPDGCVLVTDFSGGCLRKYKIAPGKHKPVWVCYDLTSPVGIAVNSAGLIFVASYSGKKIYVIAPDGEKLKELTHPELQHVKEIYDITVDEETTSLACGANGVLSFRMVFDALVK